MRSFLNQPPSDEELAASVQMLNDAKRVAIDLIGLINQRDATTVRAADVALDYAGDQGSNLLQTITDRVFVLGLLYGLRVGGGVR